MIKSIMASLHLNKEQIAALKWLLQDVINNDYLLEKEYQAYQMSKSGETEANFGDLISNNIRALKSIEIEKL